jgi:hypothetical protein
MHPCLDRDHAAVARSNRPLSASRNGITLEQPQQSAVTRGARVRLPANGALILTTRRDVEISPGKQRDQLSPAAKLELLINSTDVLMHG